MSDDGKTDDRTVTVLPPDPSLDTSLDTSLDPGLDENDAIEMERVAAKAGRNGNIYAIHVWNYLHEQRRRRVAIDLPALETRADLEKAQLAVIAAAARGRLTPRDALDFSAMLENRRRALATQELEARLRTLEKINAEQAAKEPPR